LFGLCLNVALGTLDFFTVHPASGFLAVPDVMTHPLGANVPALCYLLYGPDV